MRLYSTADLELQLPEGWVEHPNPGGPLEFRPGADSARGLLQVSRRSPEEFEFYRTAALGLLAEALGQKLNHTQNWGQSQGSRNAGCAMGSLGMAMFRGGEFASMILWLTVAADAAFLWTWLGPDPQAAEVEAALGIVVSARRTA